MHVPHLGKGSGTQPRIKWKSREKEDFQSRFDAVCIFKILRMRTKPIMAICGLSSSGLFQTPPPRVPISRPLSLELPQFRLRPQGLYSTPEKALRRWLCPQRASKVPDLVRFPLKSPHPLGAPGNAFRINLDLLIWFDWLITSEAADFY